MLCPPDGQDGHTAAQTLWLHWTKVFLAETGILPGFDLSSAVSARHCTRDLLVSGQPFCEQQTKMGLVFLVFVVFSFRQLGRHGQPGCTNLLYVCSSGLMIWWTFPLFDWNSKVENVSLGVLLILICFGYILFTEWKPAWCSCFCSAFTHKIVNSLEWLFLYDIRTESLKLLYLYDSCIICTHLHLWFCCLTWPFCHSCSRNVSDCDSMLVLMNSGRGGHFTLFNPRH